MASLDPQHLDTFAEEDHQMPHDSMIVVLREHRLAKIGPQHLPVDQDYSQFVGNGHDDGFPHDCAWSAQEWEAIDALAAQ